MPVSADCTLAPTPVHGVVVFSATEFRTLFPQFAGAVPSDAILGGYFVDATIIVNNSCASVVDDANTRLRLLYLLVAHIAALAPTSANGGPNSGAGAVGRVASASEGSVSISAEYAAEVSQSMAWFIQTQYGALFWQLTSPYRSFRYAAPAYCCGPGGAFAGRRGY